MTARRGVGGLSLGFVAAALLALPVAAQAAPVPGATYTGTASDGATITLTVSSNGESVSSYRVLGISGTDSNGQTCQDNTSVGPAGWPGAAITDDSFQTSIETLFSITGTFGGSQSVSGTFDLSQPPQSGTAGCSTGTVTWTAKTSSTSGGGNPNGGHKKKAFGIRVSVRRPSPQKLVGSLKSSSAACTARRRVYLWLGHKRLTSRRASKKGAFTFKVGRSWRGRRVHASVRLVSTKTGICKAGSSSTIRG